MGSLCLLSSSELSMILPRVLIVSRRTVRKNKFVDFVGEYHLDLIVSYGAVPVIVPRVNGVSNLLKSFQPIHGVLLCEGEDIDPSHYDSNLSTFTPEELEEIKQAHISDTSIDREKDSIELSLAKLCLERNIPYLGICRGSQVLNVACGGTLYQDVEKELSRNTEGERERVRVAHMDYDNYDGHRHEVNVVENTPLYDWFKESLSESEGREILVNSYHHQGVKKLAKRLVAMAYAPDGLIEGFYDPDCYDPDEGKFIVGLQFHPECMRNDFSDEFDYPGCPFAYKEFVKAVIAYQKKLSNQTTLTKAPKLNQEQENKRKIIVRSSSIAKDMYMTGRTNSISDQLSELEPGEAFLEENKACSALSLQEEKRLKQIGATVRNGHGYKKLKLKEDKEKVARKIIGKLSVQQLSNMMSFYYMMGQICSEVLDTKLQGLKLGDHDDSLDDIIE